MNVWRHDLKATLMRWRWAPLPETIIELQVSNFWTKWERVLVASLVRAVFNKSKVLGSNIFIYKLVMVDCMSLIYDLFVAQAFLPMFQGFLSSVAEPELDKTGAHYKRKNFEPTNLSIYIYIYT